MMEEKMDVDEVHWIVGENEVDDYKKAGAKHVIAGGSLVKSRNTALKNAWDNKKTSVMLDDDLKKIQKIVVLGDKKKKIEISYIQAVEIIDSYLERNKLLLGGVAPTANDFFYNEKRPIGYAHFLIASFQVTRPCELYFDEIFRTKEDYDYTLQHVQKYGAVCRCNFITPIFTHYTNKGGCVDYRTKEVEQDSIKKLKSKWGKLIRDNPRRPNEILLNMPRRKLK